MFQIRKEIKPHTPEIKKSLLSIGSQPRVGGGTVGNRRGKRQRNHNTIEIKSGYDKYKKVLGKLSKGYLAQTLGLAIRGRLDLEVQDVEQNYEG